MGVMKIAAERYLFGSKATAHLEMPFQYQYLLSRFAQISRHGEPVRPTADNDEIVFLHFAFLSLTFDGGRSAFILDLIFQKEHLS